jgi:thiamine biosynthesis lipoprotein
MADKTDPALQRFNHQAMGTTFELMISGEKEDYARQVSRAVFDQIDRLETLFSRFNPCSEIGQINKLFPGESVRVGIEVFECLQLAQYIRMQTEAAFDINYASGKVTRSSPGAFKLEQVREGFLVKIPSGQKAGSLGGIELDLGGIGKGYALDKSIEILSEWEIRQALLHAGTSTAYAMGDPPDPKQEDKGWPVGIGGVWKCAQAPRRFHLRGRALSGSGTEVKGEHVINPRSFQPAKGHRAAWVSHPSAAVADALSTAFMVMKTKEVEDFCKRFSEVWGLVILDEKRCKIFNGGLALTDP